MLDFFCATFKSAMTLKCVIFYFSVQLFSFYHVYIVITVTVNIQRHMLNLTLTNKEPIFNSVHHLHQPYTIAIRQQWLTPGVSNCMVFNFNDHISNFYLNKYVKIVRLAKLVKLICIHI